MMLRSAAHARAASSDSASTAITKTGMARPPCVTVTIEASETFANALTSATSIKTNDNTDSSPRSFRVPPIRVWATAVLAVALGIASIGCGGDDTDELRQQIASLQSQVAQPTTPPIPTMMATEPPSPAVTSGPSTATPVPPTTVPPRPTSIPVISVQPTAIPTATPTATAVPPTPTITPPACMQGTPLWADCSGVRFPNRCTYLVIASGPLTPEQARVLGAPYAWTLRDTVTGAIQNFYANGPLQIGTCYPEGGYP